MTDAEATTLRDYSAYDFANDPDGMEKDDIQPPDWLFELFLRYITGLDDQDTEAASLTVTAGGVIVTGFLISGGEHARLAEEALSNANPGSGQAYATLAHAPDERRREMIERRDAAQLPIPRRRYFHMRDVVLSPGTANVRFDLWRGRVDEVTGWTFASINAN